MRRQTACNLVLRLTWETSPGHSHPRHTYLCVEDLDMARDAATVAGERAPRAIRLVEAHASKDAGRTVPWSPVPLGEPVDVDGWLSGACVTMAAC